MYDSIEELTSRNNNIYQLYKYMQKKFAITEHDDPFKIFKGLPFYRFDLSKEEHAKIYREPRSRCCWNHFVGLPEKNGKRFPLFDYQEEVFNDFMKSWRDEPLDDGRVYRFFAVLK